MPIPFSRTIAGRGRPFPCRACGKEIQLLVNKKAAAGLGISSLALIKAVGAWSVPIIIAGLGIIDWLYSKVSLVDANPNPPSANL